MQANDRPSAPTRAASSAHAMLPHSTGGHTFPKVLPSSCVPPPFQRSKVSKSLPDFCHNSRTAVCSTVCLEKRSVRNRDCQESERHPFGRAGARSRQRGRGKQEGRMADKWSDQIRACGLFFISIVVLMIIPLVYHCFVFLTAIPLWETQPASCVILLVSFHTLFVLLIMSYWKTIFTDAGGVPYELDEAWVGGAAFLPSPSTSPPLDWSTTTSPTFRLHIAQASLVAHPPPRPAKQSHAVCHRSRNSTSRTASGWRLRCLSACRRCQRHPRGSSLPHPPDAYSRRALRLHLIASNARTIVVQSHRAERRAQVGWEAALLPQVPQVQARQVGRGDRLHTHPQASHAHPCCCDHSSSNNTPQGRKMHAETHSHTRTNCEKARASEQQKHQNAVEVIDCGVATQGPPLQVLRTLRAQDGPSLSMGEQLYRIPQLQVFYALLLLRNHDVILRGAHSLHRLC